MFVQTLNGESLAAWRVASARRLPGEVWFCAKNEEVAGGGKNLDADVALPWPEAMTSASVPMERVCLYAMEHARRIGRKFDALALLPPASPFVGPDSLARAVAALKADPHAHGAVAVRAAQPGSALIQPDNLYLDALAIRLGHKQHAEKGVEITPSGGFFLARWERFLIRHTFYAETTLPVRVRGWEAITIRTQAELEFADFLASTGRARPGENPAAVD